MFLVFNIIYTLRTQQPLMNSMEIPNGVSTLSLVHNDCHIATIEQMSGKVCTSNGNEMFGRTFVVSGGTLSRGYMHVLFCHEMNLHRFSMEIWQSLWILYR